MPTHDDPGSPFRLLVTPATNAIPANRAVTLRLLVRIQAPDTPPGTLRQPLHLALVLDRSGSMSGQPLDEARRCARHIIDSLGPDDRAAIFAFDDTVERVAPLTAASQKLTLIAALATIDAGGSTNLHGGWRAGAQELAAALAGEDVHRVILLSDGCANQGETGLEPISGECKSFARQGVSTSTYGLGRDFNEDLMLAMAAAGRGNAYYGQTAADLAEPFAAEFALLTSLAARGLVLKVTAPHGVAVRMRNDYEAVEGHALTWKLPDLAFASEAWAMLEADVPATDAAILHLPITVAVQASAQDSSPLFLIGALPPLAVVDAAAWEALPTDEVVARRAMELDAADALLALRDAVAADDWPLARYLVDAASTRFAGHAWAAAILATMRRLVGARDKRLAGKEAMFARRAMSVRLSAREESQFLPADELDLPAFLRRKGEQGKGQPRKGEPGSGDAFRGDGGDGQNGA
jgi:Ca-activated chloride channel homolog